MDVQVAELAHLSNTRSNPTEQLLRGLGGSSLLPRAQEPGAAEKGGVAGSSGRHAVVLLERPLQGSVPHAGEGEDAGGEGRGLSTPQGWHLQS